MPSTRLAALLALLLLATSCSFRPKFGTEDSGRPALILHGDSNPPSGAHDTGKAGATAAGARAESKATPPRSGAALDTDVLLRRAAELRQQGDLPGAAVVYRQALEITEQRVGPNHAEVAAILTTLAAVEAAQGNYDTALPLLERALGIRRQTLGDDNELTAQSMNNLALLYAAKGNAAAAEPLYQQAIAILENAKTPPASGELERILDNYAALLHDTGRDAEADELEARARLLRAVGASR